MEERKIDFKGKEGKRSEKVRKSQIDIGEESIGKESCGESLIVPKKTSLVAMIDTNTCVRPDRFNSNKLVENYTDFDLINDVCPVINPTNPNPFFPGTLTTCSDETSPTGESVEAGDVSVHKSKEEVLCDQSKCLSGEETTVSTGQGSSKETQSSDKCPSEARDVAPSEAKDEASSEENQTSTIKCGLINARGFYSKEASIRNIIVDEALDVMFIVETQCVLNEYPKVPGYHTFFRNREKKKGGGIAILVTEELKGKVRLVDVGKDDLETISITIRGFTKPVILTCYYGQQENTSGTEVVNEHLAKIVGDAQSASADGAMVILAGDFNVKTGDKLTPNPNKVMSKAGKSLVDMLEGTNIKCVNSKDVNNTQFTHVDRTSNTSNVLDYVMTSHPDQVLYVEVDGGFSKSPHYTRLTKGQEETAFTDHCAIFWKVSVNTKEEEGRKPKIKRWKYNKPGGEEAYRAFLEEQYENIRKVIVEESTEKSAQFILETVEKAKKVAYGKTTCTTAKLERLEEIKLWEKRRKELDEFVTKANDQPGKEMHRIFFARKEVLNKFRNEQPAAIKNLKTGEILTDQKEIDKYTLEYNKELLTKKIPVGKWGDQREEHANQLEDMINLHDEESREPLTPKEYLDSVMEVHEAKKDCYIDFIRAGPLFHGVIFTFIQKVYLTGEVPSEFKKSNLMKLYKKGDRKLLSNYRFLHLKHWLPKITEKVVMKRLKEKMSVATPAEQLGGVRDASCEEHLVTLTTVMNTQARKKEVTAVTFMDVVKCFDQMPLTEVCFQAGKAGINGNPLKVLRDINSDTRMTIVGDDSGESFIAKDTVGQGLVSACEGSALAMGIALNTAMKKKVGHIEIGGVQVEASAFVDDAAQADRTSEGVRSTGQCLSEALDELGLEAHPVKSVRVTCGPAPAKRKIKAELENNPQKIQGAVIKDVEEERYLGLLFTDKNTRKNITRNIEDKKAKVMVKVKVIKRLLKHPVMLELGWMRAAIGLLQSIVVQTILYGTISFIGMTKTHIKDLEKLQKDAIYDVLGLSKFANYSAVLAETGILRLEDSVKLRKMSFINKLMEAREICKCRDILIAEEEQGGQGLLAEVRQYCEEYDLPDVTKNNQQIRKNDLKDQVKWKSTKATWWQVMKSNKAIARWHPEKNSNRSYFSFQKLESKLMLALMIGELNFLTNRREENIKKLGSTRCYVGVCGGEDELEHVSQCFGYSSTPSGDHSELGQAQYLVELNAERIKNFGTSLIYLPAE